MPILTVRGALPDHHHQQSEITDAFVDVIAGGVALDEQLLRRFHANAGVRAPAHVLPLEEYAALGDFGAPTTCSSSTRSSSARAPSSTR